MDLRQLFLRRTRHQGVANLAYHHMNLVFNSLQNELIGDNER